MSFPLRARASCIAAFVAALALRAAAVTRLPSADGQFWDVQDTSPWSQDSGGIATGGRANPFNGFGYLKLQAPAPRQATPMRGRYLHGFGLAYDGAERFDSITPLLVEGMMVSRAIFAPKEANYLRYLDSFTNATNEERSVEVAWGGAVGAYADGGKAAVADTASGDRTIDARDAWVAVMQN